MEEFQIAVAQHEWTRENAISAHFAVPYQMDVSRGEMVGAILLTYKGDPWGEGVRLPHAE